MMPTHSPSKHMGPMTPSGVTKTSRATSQPQQNAHNCASHIARRTHNSCSPLYFEACPLACLWAQCPIALSERRFAHAQSHRSTKLAGAMPTPVMAALLMPVLAILGSFNGLARPDLHVSSCKRCMTSQTQQASNQWLVHHTTSYLELPSHAAYKSTVARSCTSHW